MNTEKIKKKHPLQVKRRHQLLLEVMIAFALIVICIIPLLQPHWFMLRYQQEFIKQVELDHFVNNMYGDFVQKLYMNQIEWRDLDNNKSVEISEDSLRHAGLPFKGSYRFSVLHKKSKKNVDFSVYVFGLDFTFERIGGNKSIPDKPEASRNYHYEFCVVRDLSKGLSSNSEPEPDSSTPPVPEETL